MRALARESFLSVPHSLSSPQPGLNCDTIITIGINKHEVVENYNFEALCGHCFLMQLECLASTYTPRILCCK